MLLERTHVAITRVLTCGHVTYTNAFEYTKHTHSKDIAYMSWNLKKICVKSFSRYQAAHLFAHLIDKFCTPVVAFYRFLFMKPTYEYEAQLSNVIFDTSCI